MKNYIGLAILVAVTTVMSACSERVVYLTPDEVRARAEAQANADRQRTSSIQRKLPEGCEFRDLGGYYSTGPWVYVSAIFCKNTVTTTSSWQSGKSNLNAATTTIVE